MRIFLAFALLFLPFTSFAVPGPLVSGGIGLISNAGALFAIAAGMLAVSVAHAWQWIGYWKTKHPKAFVAAACSLSATVFVLAYFVFRTPADPVANLREAIRSRPPSSPSSSDLSRMEGVLSFSSWAGTARDAGYPELEKEIAFSVGRNRNVVWSRYLSDRKIRIDDGLIDSLSRGEYALPISDLLSDLSSHGGKYSVIDLRTPEEYGTSAHFASGANVEYRKIMNDEVVFDPAKTYVTVCHDGAFDLSRSLVAAIYLRGKGIRAYALDTGMKPLLDSFSVAPISFRTKPPFAVWEKGDAVPRWTVVDPLGALSTLPGVRDAGFRIRPFQFYRMDTPQYEAELSSFRAIVEKGEGVDFACYDTFSCFYSRIFADRFVSEFPSGKITIRIFR